MNNPSIIPDEWLVKQINLTPIKTAFHHLYPLFKFWIGIEINEVKKYLSVKADSTREGLSGVGADFDILTRPDLANVAW